MERIEIRKYKNRKLYNKNTSAYVTINDIKSLIRAGKNVVVVDHATKNEVTADILLQAIFEAEQKRASYENLALLKAVIKTKGTFGRFVESQVDT